MEYHNNRNMLQLTQKSVGGGFNKMIDELRQMSDEHEAYERYEKDKHRTFRSIEEEIEKMNDDIKKCEEDKSRLLEILNNALSQEVNKQIEFEQQLLNGLEEFYVDADICKARSTEIKEHFKYYKETVERIETKEFIVLNERCQKRDKLIGYLHNEAMDTTTLALSRNDKKYNIMGDEVAKTEELKKKLFSLNKKALEVKKACEECYARRNAFLADLENKKNLDIKDKETQLRKELDILEQEKLECNELRNKKIAMETKLKETKLELERLKIEKKMEERKYESLEKQTIDLNEEMRRKNEKRLMLESLEIEMKKMKQDLSKIEEEKESESEVIKEIQQQMKTQKLSSESKLNSRELNKQKINELKSERLRKKEKWERLKETYKQEEVKNRNGQEEDLKMIEPYTKQLKRLVKHLKNIKNWDDNSIIESEIKLIQDLEAEDFNKDDEMIDEVQKNRKGKLKKYRAKMISILSSLKSQEKVLMKLRKDIQSFVERNHQIDKKIEEDQSVIDQLKEEQENITEKIEEVNIFEMQWREKINEVETMERELEACLVKNEQLEAQLMNDQQAADSGLSKDILSKVLEEKKCELQKLKEGNVKRKNLFKRVKQVTIPGMMEEVDGLREKIEREKNKKDP